MESGENMSSTTNSASILWAGPRGGSPAEPAAALRSEVTEPQGNVCLRLLPAAAEGEDRRRGRLWRLTMKTHCLLPLLLLPCIFSFWVLHEAATEWLLIQPASIPALQSEYDPPRLSSLKGTDVAESGGRSQPSSLRSREESDSLLQHIQVRTHQSSSTVLSSCENQRVHQDFQGWRKTKTVCLLLAV